MAVIQKLRNSKIVAGVIMGALILFVLGELFKGNNNSGAQNESSVGIIAGKKVSAIEYENIKKELTQEVLAVYGEQTDPKAVKDYVKEAAWRELIDRKIKNKLYSDLGVTTSTEEIMSLIKSNNMPQSISQLFQGKSNEEVITLVQQQYRSNPGFTKSFNFQLRAAKKERTEKKYAELITKSLFATDVEAENDYLNNTTKLSGKIVSMDYYEVPDNKINVTDEELATYFTKHKAEFKQEESRDIEYTSWSLLPSANDSAMKLQEINDIKSQFEKSTNDSTFARRQSQMDYNPNFFSVASPEAKSIPSEAVEMAIGEFYGPVLKNGVYTVYKKLAHGTDTITNYRASHILIKPRGKDTSWAYNKAKEIRAKITDQKSFEKMARAESQDGSAQSGGDLGWFSKGKMVKVFETFVMNNSKGKIGIVKSQFGVHIIKVTANPTRKTYKLAQVNRVLRAGKLTKNILFKQVREFNAKVHAGDKSFSEIAESMSLKVFGGKKIKSKDQAIPGITGSKEIVKWLYNDDRKEKDVSSEFNIGDNIYVVQATSFKEKDKPVLDDVKREVTKKVRNEKKALIIEKKFAKTFKADVGAVDLALGLGKVAQTFESSNFSSGSLVGLGSDFRAVGHVFGMKEKTNSGIQKSDNGVFVCYLDKVVKGEEQKTWKARRQSLIQNSQGLLNYQLQSGALDKALDIKDERYKIY